MANSMNKIVVAALSGFKLPVAENIYEGTAASYFVYNYADDILADAGDDDPQAYVASMQIHYICPLQQSYSDMKRRIRKALIDAGFTPPEVTDASDTADRTRHLVFECEMENIYDLESAPEEVVVVTEPTNNEGNSEVIQNG